MADVDRISDSNVSDGPDSNLELPVELTAEQLRQICGGTSVPPPQPQPS